MNCPAHLSSVTKPKLRDGPCSDPRGQPLQPKNESMYAKRSEFQQLRRYFNLLSSRLTPESGLKWLGVLSEPLNLWTTKVSHFFAILFDMPTSAASKRFPVCRGCGATVFNDTTSMTVDHGRSKSLSYFVAHNNQQGCCRSKPTFTRQ